MHMPHAMHKATRFNGTGVAMFRMSKGDWQLIIGIDKGGPSLWVNIEEVKENAREKQERERERERISTLEASPTYDVQSGRQS